MKKGDIVRASAYVVAEYGGYGDVIHEPSKEFLDGVSKYHSTHRIRRLRRRNRVFVGMVIGYTFRQTGYQYVGYDYEDPTYLNEDKRHFVYLVEPIDRQRWLKPFACLPNDLEVLDRSYLDMVDWEDIPPLEEEEDAEVFDTA